MTRIRVKWNACLFVCAAMALMFSPAVRLEAAPAPADNSWVGVWACQSMSMGAYTGRSCPMEPWLHLNADGSYEWSSEQGRWQVKSGALTLSERAGAGHLNSDGKLIFEYDLHGKHFVLTLYKRQQ